ncbi:tRNA:m(4)X modification enzyme TRM13 homolog isoform X1 [Patella vulgata]|uniref:tRNA:m(4)X modification enzyme TRM13 homolog isoform X1 n=2 Tax=Patella vulgata TaxID=6465 RepID=UPI00217FA3FD|nr:tRNA:m(4)X modification enzyme TRM13 homolog isoform X1 [Patella vulgata]
MEKLSPRPEIGQCSFFLKKKNRFCRFRPNKSQIYCAEHSLEMGVELERKRVTCPLNPSHTCYEDCLQKHLKKCNNRRKAEEVYYVEGINSGSDIEEDKVSVNSISGDELQNVINRINKLYDDYIGCIEEEILTHACLQEELDNETYGTSAMRHRKQQASLVGHMEKLGLLKDNTSFIEMGAGKGQLSHWVQKAMTDKENLSFLLVDRGSARYKFDSYHKSEEEGPKFERIKIDIEHLDLGKVKSISNSDKIVTAIGKHLCGAATDLALRCLIRPVDTDTELPCKRLKADDTENDRRSHTRCPKGIVIALCCHHRCTWKTYVGKKFMRSNGISSHDFQLLLSISSWATCSWQGWKAEERGKASKIENQEADHEDDKVEDYRGNIKLDKSEREMIGRKCKRLIDHGRIQYLHDHKMTACLKHYIDGNLTPENVVLLATIEDKV